MAIPEVRCAVANCEYWNQGNKCGADLIMIDVDQNAKAKYDQEFAGESFDTGHQEDASSSANTCCHTFKRKAE